MTSGRIQPFGVTSMDDNADDLPEQQRSAGGVVMLMLHLNVEMIEPKHVPKRNSITPVLFEIMERVFK